MGPLDFLDDEIAELERAGRLRRRLVTIPSGVTVACANDYLGYGKMPRGASRLGATGSRLVVGDCPEHLALEKSLADWVAMPEALLFTSGFAANLGALSALGRENDLIVSVNLNHASIVDGCRLSRATVKVVDLGDLPATRLALQAPAKRKWLVTESYYSMDGIVPDLRALRQAADEVGAAMIVDEAHALGVFGPNGAGVCADQGVRPDILIGTLGKAVAGQGAFVASTHAAITWLWNRARSFVFSTGMSPMLCARLLENVQRARADDAGRQALADNVRRFRSALDRAGIPVLPGSTGPIVPVIVGDSQRAVAYEQELLRSGFFVRAIRPPTVPEGTARLRITLSAAMSESDLDRLAEALRACA